MQSYEAAVVQFLAAKGMGISAIKRVFEHSRTKDEIRCLLNLEK